MTAAKNLVMRKSQKTSPADSEEFCKSEIERMLKYSQTKVIMPVVTLGLLLVFKETGQRVFSDAELKKAYEAAVKAIKEFLGHDVKTRRNLGSHLNI